ncbi:hypothetical protein CGQ24_11525 [Arthrobacter sp. 7749]|nr:hypothetical protein CGQ24_11525 [Arthrobacter sp. 7749]
MVIDSTVASFRDPSYTLRPRAPNPMVLMGAFDAEHIDGPEVHEPDAAGVFEETLPKTISFCP